MLTRNSILRFVQNNYNTDQIVISSVGRISFPSIIKLIENYFGSAKKNNRIKNRNQFTNYIPGIRILDKDTFQSHCIIGNIACDISNPKRMTMILLNNIIGSQSMNSRLNLALREKNGIAYNIESGYTAYSDTGLFNVYFGTDKENLNKAIDLVLKEFKLLREKKLGVLQLKKAQKQLMGQIAISIENHEDLMLTIGKNYMLFNKVEPVAILFRKIEAITQYDLLEAANEVLNTDKLSRLIYR